MFLYMVKQKKDCVFWRHLVDRKKVYDALQWLYKNNENYKDLHLPEFEEFKLGDDMDQTNMDNTENEIDSNNEQSRVELPEEKSWIEQITPSQLKIEYGHCTVNSLENDIMEETQDLYKMLKITSEPIPSHEKNLDCLAFPSIFPYGKGGRKSQIKTLLKHCWRKHM